MSDILQKPAGVRWWPAALVALAGASTLGWVWLSDGGRDGQDRVMLTFPIAFAMLLLLAIWLVFLSRLARKRRFWAIGAVLVTLLAAAATTRIRGVTGDLVPIVEWRWASRVPPVLGLEPVREPLTATREAPVAAPASTATGDTPSPKASVAPPPVEPPASRPLAGDYPQFLGADRNGTVTGVRLSDDWATRPPRLVWRRPIGAGWSGFAVARGLAVTQEQRGSREMVVAYNLVDGTPKWAHGDEAHYESTIAGEGPRATPTISRGRVFTLGSTGLLNCLDLETGKAIWRRDIGADNDSAQPDWGRSSSPLVVDDLIVVSAGGSPGRSLVAYHRDSGEPAWRAGDDLASYSSPVLATLAGARQIVVLNQSSVAGHDPATGRVLWNHPWPRQAPSVAAPLILPDNRVLLSAGYGMGSHLLQIARDGDGVSQTLVWESTRLKAKFTNPVVHGGFVYGLDDGVLVCLDPSNGERRWKGGRYGHGQTILVGNRLIVTTEDGDIVLVEARPDVHRELARFTAFSQKAWNPPALAGRFLLVRTDTEAACYELAGES
jgi:outer membrane protein assembly factor BamB